MKRTAALLLALMLATGAFASCGSKDNEETKAPDSTVTGNAAAEGEKEEENKEETYDINFLTKREYAPCKICISSDE